MSWICLEYRCPSGHTHDSLEVRDEPSTHIACATCGEKAKRILSAPRIKTPLFSVVRGSGPEEHNPNIPDTSLLADGMSRKEWRAKYAPPKKHDPDMVRAVRRVLDLPESKAKGIDWS